MSRSAFNIKSKEEASQLHQKVITEFVDEAVKQLEAGGYFLYATEISSERNGWQTSISYGNNRYIAVGESISNALYEELVMPCDWLALRWKQEFGMRHKPVRESKSSCHIRLDIGSAGGFDREAFLNKNKQLIQECEAMCQERKANSANVVKTTVFT